MHRQALKDLQTLHTPTLLPRHREAGKQKGASFYFQQVGSTHRRPPPLTLFYLSSLVIFVKNSRLTDEHRGLVLTSSGCFPENL